MSDRLDNEVSTRRVTFRSVVAALLEIALIFGVFAAYGAWPVPDVNEQYYVGKAIHFWNNDWLGHDPFLNTPDSHWLFYAVFGLLSLVFKQNALVWVGRSVVWLATAIAWRRLTRAFFPQRWVAVLTAAAFAFYLESFHLAGEWIIGGVEGKGLAFPFVFWGLACFIEGKYNRAWILYGIGAAFHVLVGGWAVLASLFVWALDALRRPQNLSSGEAYSRFKTFWRKLLETAPGLLIGGAISLLGVVPALKLDVGATAAEIAQSRQIYVFERLSHHLVASSLPWTFLVRFGGLVLAFGIAWLISAMLARLALGSNDAPGALEDRRYFRLKAFVVVSLLFACAGLVVDWGSIYLEKIGKIADHKLSAGILRYYWYRLSDWAVPFGLVFLLGRSVFDLTTYLRARRQSSAETSSARASTLVGQALMWLACGCSVYWGLRSFFCRIARRVAASSAVDGLIPLPKPTEAVSFITSIGVLGCALLILLVFLAIRSRKTKELQAPTWITTGLAVWLAVLALFAPCWRLATFVDLRGTKVIPRSAPPKESIADGWIDVCHWCRDNTPEKAIFLVPRGCDSFKWEAQRAEAGSWKEIPQDAKSMMLWYKKMKQFYANPGADPKSPNYWNQPLVGVFINKGRDAVLQEAKEYGYQYAIVEAPPYVVATIPEALKRWNEFDENDKVYQNDQFVVLKFDQAP